MALQAIPSGQIRFNAPAPCDVYDSRGKLLIRKGSQAANFMQFQAWANEGLFRKPEAAPPPAPVKPVAVEPGKSLGLSDSSSARRAAREAAEAAAAAKASGASPASPGGSAAASPTAAPTSAATPAAASPAATPAARHALGAGPSAAPSASAAPAAPSGHLGLSDSSAARKAAQQGGGAAAAAPKPPPPPAEPPPPAGAAFAAAQAALAKTRAEIAVTAAQVKPAELLERWNSLIATEARMEGQLHRLTLAELGERWLASSETASALDDALPDLAHYRLVRAIHENVRQAPAEVAAAQHLLTWLCARKVVRMLNWGAAEMSWLQDWMAATRWASLRRSGQLLDLSGFGPAASADDPPPPVARPAQRVLLSWLGQTAPAPAEGSEEALKAAAPDLVGVWIGACVSLHQRTPSCLNLPAGWMKMAEARGPEWRRCAQATGVILKKVWGSAPPGTYVGLANGDTGIVVKAGATVNECLVLRICSREGSNYTELPRRNASMPDHLLKGILPVGEISVRVSHERVVERGYN